MDVYNQLFEMTMENRSRRPMTPEEMIRFYAGMGMQRQSRISRLGAALVNAVDALGQRFHLGTHTATPKPAYRRA